MVAKAPLSTAMGCLEQREIEQSSMMLEDAAPNTAPWLQRLMSHATAVSVVPLNAIIPSPQSLTREQLRLISLSLPIAQTPAASQRAMSHDCSTSEAALCASTPKLLQPLMRTLFAINLPPSFTMTPQSHAGAAAATSKTAAAERRSRAEATPSQLMDTSCNSRNPAARYDLIRLCGREKDAMWGHRCRR